MPLFRVNLIGIFHVKILCPLSFTFLIIAPFLDLYCYPHLLTVLFYPESWHQKKKTKTGTLEAILILSHLSKFHNYICFIFKLLLPNSVQQPETQQLLGSGVVFLFFPGFNSTTIKALWLWNTITNSANAPASLQAILCQCCTYCVVLQMQ